MVCKNRGVYEFLCTSWVLISMAHRTKKSWYWWCSDFTFGASVCGIGGDFFFFVFNSPADW